MAEEELINVTIDGHAVQVPKGTLVLDAATKAGIHIPIYCAHSKMDPVAVCRMCLVEVEKMPKLQPACATVVAEGMVVTTSSAPVTKTREGMLEFLLMNHPLDCPVCDRGGECDLQDFTLRYGPPTSRFPITEKVHFDKAVPLSQHIELDQERCILCWRCVRYYDEITGEKELVLGQRGVKTVIRTFNSEPLQSEFQGNLPEVCPVGALTHREFRFVARPWDLQRAKSVCPECSYGCNIWVDSREFQVKRFASRDNPQVDDMWLCDRGRYSFPRWNSKERIRHSALLENGIKREVSAEQAIEAAINALRSAKETGGEKIAVLGSAENTNEELWLLQRLAREVLGTANVDHGLDTPAELDPEEHSLGIAELENCSVVVVVGEEPEKNAPVLTLRLRKAATKKQVAVHRVAADAKAADLAVKLKDVTGPVGVVLDETNRQNGKDIAAAIAKGGAEVKRLTITRGVNGRGAKDLGVTPVQGPAYKKAAKTGKGGREILEGLRSGQLETLLVLNGAALFAGEDARAVETALRKAKNVVAVESRPSVVSEVATVLIAGHSYVEKSGSVTNCEGRVQRIRPALPPTAQSPSGTRVLARLAEGLGAESWPKEPSAVYAEICREVSAYAEAGNGGRAVFGRVAVK